MTKDVEFDRKKQAALAVLEQSNILKGHYLPPMTRFAWRFDWQAKPPHFINPWLSFVGLSAYFSAAMFVFMSMFSLVGLDGRPLFALLWPCLLGGLAFGLGMALYYFFSVRYNRLPKWDDL